MSAASKALSAASKACQQLVKHYQQQSVGEIPKRSDVIYYLSICTQTYNAHTYRRASECVCIVEKTLRREASSKNACIHRNKYNV